jgi:hypothetical protein
MRASLRHLKRRSLRRWGFFSLKQADRTCRGAWIRLPAARVAVEAARVSLLKDTGVDADGLEVILCSIP